MSKKRDQRKKKKRRSGGGGGGRLSGMRSGMKSFVGTGAAKKKKESTLSKVLWFLVMAAAVAFLVYKWFLQ